MKRIGSGYFSAAYSSTNERDIIIFSIDPMKEVLCDIYQDIDSIHVPKIEKILENTEYDDTISVYRMEKLIPIWYPMSRRDNGYSCSTKRSNAIWDYDTLSALLLRAKIKHHMVWERFEYWMDALDEKPHVIKYRDALVQIYEHYYNAFSEDLAWDFHEMNVSVRPRQSDLVFSDIFAVGYLANTSEYRIRRRYPDRLLRTIYTE